MTSEFYIKISNLPQDVRDTFRGYPFTPTTLEEVENYMKEHHCAGDYIFVGWGGCTEIKVMINDIFDIIRLGKCL